MSPIEAYSKFEERHVTGLVVCVLLVCIATITVSGIYFGTYETPEAQAIRAQAHAEWMEANPREAAFILALEEINSLAGNTMSSDARAQLVLRLIEEFGDGQLPQQQEETRD